MKTMHTKRKVLGNGQCRHVFPFSEELPLIYSCLKKEEHKGLHKGLWTRLHKTSHRILRKREFYWSTLKTERICTYCRENLPLNKENFYSVKTEKFKGFSYTCKKCMCTIKNTKERYKQRREYALKYSKKWQKDNPEKYKASIMVRTAIKKGEMKREPCEVCGEKKSHGHHDDYTKPLQVRWLCARHHQRHHRSLTSI